MNKKIFLIIIFFGFLTQAQIKKDSTQNKVYRVIPKDSVKFYEPKYPIFPYHDKNYSGKENLNFATVNVFISILVTNNKIELFEMEGNYVTILLNNEGKLELKNISGGRKEYRKLLNQTFVLFQKHYNFLDSIGKKIIVSDSKNNGLFNNTFSIPTRTGFECYEDKYNLNDSVLRGPFIGSSNEIPVKDYINVFMDLRNKIYDLLNLDTNFDTKKEIKILFKISKKGELSLEDVKVNDKVKLDYFKKEMQLINDWLEHEKQKGNLLQPAINIFNENVDYYLEYSNFSLNKDN